mgnify:CR=1 FL=1
MIKCNPKDDNGNKWNLASLHEHITILVSNLEDKFDIKLSALDNKLDKIDKINDVKHESMNQVREQLDDQARTFVTKEMYESKHEVIENKIEALQKLVFIGLGVWMVIQGIIVVVLVFIFKV